MMLDYENYNYLILESGLLFLLFYISDIFLLIYSTLFCIYKLLTVAV
jgi:hypothetical protein